MPALTSNRHVIADQPAGARLLCALVQEVAEAFHFACGILLTLRLLDLCVRVLRTLREAILHNVPVANALASARRSRKLVRMHALSTDAKDIGAGRRDAYMISSTARAATSSAW